MMKTKQRMAKRHMMKRRLQLRSGAAGALLGIALAAMPAGHSVAQAASRIKLVKLLARAGEPSVLAVADLRKVAPDFDGKSFVMTTADADTLEIDAAATIFRPVPAQGDDLDGDGRLDEIAFSVGPNTGARRVVTLAYGEEAVIAPLRVAFPPRVHAAFHRKYEGMGWENERQAWRIYFDRRNAIDLYGKLQHGLLLEHFALPATDYHAQSPLGRDIYKNGDALGIGSVGAYVNGQAVKVSDVRERKWRVIAKGPLRAIAELIYNGWQVGGKSVDLTSRFTIWAGTHGFEHAVTARAADGSNLDGLQFVTGLPVKAGLPALRGPRYLATWGKQVLRPGATASDSLPDQNLGLAIVLPGGAPGPEVLSDPNNHLVKLTLDTGGRARFGVLAVWDQEAPDGEAMSSVHPPNLLGPDPALRAPHVAQSGEAWERYADTAVRILSQAPLVRLLSRRAAPAAQPADAQPEEKNVLAPKTYKQAIALMQTDVERTARRLAGEPAATDGAANANAATAANAPATNPNTVNTGAATTANATTTAELPFFDSRDNARGVWREGRGPGWTGSFWVGQLWLLHERTRDPRFAAWARRWNDQLLGLESKQNHDTGFLNFYSSAFAYQATRGAKYREGALRAAARLRQLYNPRTQLIAAWNVGGEDSIIDTMMNLPILWWASTETKDPAYREMGRQHALRSAEWLVRPDGSVIQSVHYDPATGRRRFGHTHQGFGDETAWARGTGWGLYGFAIAARETRDPQILQTAERIARFVLERLPDDGVPWHDYHDEGVYFRTKDTSAGALAANGLFALSELVPARAATYRAAGEKIVRALADRYLTPTYAGDPTPLGMLRHGSGARPHDAGLTFGDYYLLEALLWLDKRNITRDDLRR